MPSPLASLKVLDFSTLLPGPYASMVLADLGAEVVRVEGPDRTDGFRHLPPFDGGIAAWYSALNRSKRSLCVDLKKSEGTEVIKRLVKTYDVVLEQFRPGVMDRLGIGYETLKAINPRLVYCAITGYGQTGPYRDRAGHDMNYLSLAGVMSHTGRKADGPLPNGVQVADIGGGGLGGVIGILAAVIDREKTGEGQFVDISMMDACISWDTLVISQYLVGGDVPGREGGRLNGGSFYDMYRTSDDRYLSVGSLEPKFWISFCNTLGRPDMIERGYLIDPEDLRKLKDEIQEIIGSRPLDEWVKVFESADCCVEPVLDIKEMTEHPQVKARQMIVDVPKPDGTTQRQVGSCFKFSKSETVYKHHGPALGADTDDVLSVAGYSKEEIAQMREAGILGQPPTP